MEDRRGSLPLDVTILSLLALAAVLSGCSNVILAPGRPSAVIQEQNTLVTAIPITNQGKTGAESVHVTSVSVKNGAQTIPGKLISGPSSIGVGAHAPAYATFPSTSLLPGNTYTMQVQGTYLVGSALRNFAFQTPLVIAPGSPGSAPVSFASSPATRVSGAPYPPQPPNFPPEVNEGTFWTVPTGPEHPLTRTVKETTIQPAPRPGVDPPLVEIFTNEPLNLTGNSINEPSGAASTAGANSSGGPDGVVFETFNSSAAFSTNRGSTWTQVNPTTIFPNTADGGFCCDQIVQYAPTIDRFIWVMQFFKGSNGSNRERIAAASPASIISSNGTAWTFWDIASTQLNIGSDSIDYPDLSVGNNFAYLSFDDVGHGLIVVRMPLSEIQASQFLNFEFTHPGDSTMAYFGHLTQSPGDSIFWAGHNSNSSMRVFSWPESSNTYSWQDVNLGSWPNDSSNMTATTPDGLNWLGKVQSDGDFPILGSTRVAGNFGNVAGVAIDQLFFAWAASRGSGFLQPQVQWVALDKSNNFNLVTQQQLFDNTAAIAYPALATNSNGEVGVSTETGGEGAFENHAIGFLADNLVFTTTTSETGLSRYGDYATIRPDVTNTARFEAFGYGFTSGIPDTHFIIFGRGPVPTYNKVSMTITTGNDDGNSGSEIIATIAGQSMSLCLKPSTSLPADGICPNGSGATDQNGLNTWDNWHVSTFTKDLDTPQTSAAGFSSITIILLQSSCETFCDNWDLQGITVVFSDTTGVLPPITLLNESAPSHEGNNCIARLKASPNPNSASFPLDGSNGGGMFPGGGGSSVCTTSNS